VTTAKIPLAEQDLIYTGRLKDISRLKARRFDQKKREQLPCPLVATISINSMYASPD
jgi:hypothetical protein